MNNVMLTLKNKITWRQYSTLNVDYFRNKNENNDYINLIMAKFFILIV